ncbi:MAG: hypothetical protein LC799_06940 [Actinobacteria bacterium]|nr:hypothetical protein [Actinomycetota bacterium]
MTNTIVFAYCWTRARLARVIRDERGEGVISAAIAVLIMAALGAVMWIGFQELWSDASTQTSEQITKIGQ